MATVGSPFPTPNLEQIVERWQAAVSGGEMSAFGTLYASNAELLVPLSAEVLKGREAIQEFETAVCAAFPGAALQVSQPCLRSDTVAVEWEYSGTNTGPLTTPNGVLPPTNRRVSLRGASFLRCSPEGFIVEEHRYYYRSSLFEQLGLQ